MLLKRIPNATRSLGKPQDWDESANGRVSVLCVRDEVHDGKQFMLSNWEPTPDELAALMLGGSVQLWVAGTAHPVVAIGVVLDQES